MKVFTVLILFVMLVAVSSRPARPDSLPKTVWTYQVTTDNFVHSLCLSRVKAILQESRWVLEILTPSNLFIYLHQHQEFKSAIRNKELSFPQQMQIAKLFILKEYGGLWMDPTTILLDPVDWIQHLKSLEGIENYGAEGYQMVIFSSVSDREQYGSMKGSLEEDGGKRVDANLAMLLALKASPILQQWTKELLKQLKKSGSKYAVKDMQSLSLHALSTVLSSKNGTLEDSLKASKVWKLRYNDFHLNFIQLANSQDPYILADFYIKFPLTTISSQLSQPKYFISLSQVETQLDEMLNPNVSKLAYLVHNNQFNLFCPVQVNCAHYVEETSIVYTYLLKGTIFEAQIDEMINKDQRILNQCNENSYDYLLEYAKISIQWTLYLVLFIVCFKIQKICLQLMWVKLKIFGKPKYMIMKRILKTVKSVIQYESDNGI